MTLFADHSDLAALTQAAQLNAFRQNATRFGVAQAFWSSPARAATDQTSDVLEITLAAPCLVNTLTFDLAKYPHQVRIEYYDSGTWTPLLETDGTPAGPWISNCVPAVIPPPSAVGGHRNPQHAFTGHWAKQRLALRPTLVERFRLVLTRYVGETTPADIYGNAAPYSLAVRNLVVGYQVSSPDDIPRTLPNADDPSYAQPFATGNDVVDSTIDFAARTRSASHIFDGTDTIWRCQPQPDPLAVVSLYADVRSATGRAQVVDRIFIDPTVNGPHLSVYYAVDGPPQGVFVSSSDPLRPTSVIAPAGLAPDSTGLSLGGTDWVQIDNAAIGLDVGLPWWVGLVVSPHFTPTPPADGVPPTVLGTILDTGVWKLSFTDAGLQLDVVTGDSISMPFGYSGGVDTAITVGYDGTNYALWASSVIGTGAAVRAVSVGLDTLDDGVGAICIGNDLDADPALVTNAYNATWRWLVIKQETPPVDGSAFAADPRSYVRVEQFARDEPDTSRLGALLRFDPQTTLFDNAWPWRIFGGPPNKYEAMTWTPVPREYTAHRGWLHLPPIKARFWKLEFTHLAPYYADVASPIALPVRYFPQSVLDDYAARLQATAAPDPVDEAHIQAASYSSYDDTAIVVSTGGTGKGYTSTEVFLADDYPGAQRLYADRGENWAYQRHHSLLSAPRFGSTGLHTYQVKLVERTTKVAYHVGLRELRFAKVSSAARFDTPQYEDLLYDTTGVDSTGTTWIFDDDKLALTSGNSSSATLTSRVMASHRDVRGVQFAAQQSPPHQVLDDPDFRDPLLQSWSAIGNAELGDPVQVAAFGTLLPVVRRLPRGRWEDIGPRYGGTWGGIFAAGATYADLAASSGDVPNDPNGSGIVSEAIAVPRGGYIHAAARVVTTSELTDLLWLQIVDSVTGHVLAEKSVDALRGQITEWYTSFEVGTVLADDRATYDELAGLVHYPNFSDGFARADASSLGRMDSGQFWGSGTDWQGNPVSQLAIVSNRAVVGTSGDRSQIDVGTPWGSLTVQLGTSVLTGGPIDLVDLGGGYVLLNNGHVLDSNTGFDALTLTLADNDTLRFDYMPTSQVPSGQSSGKDPGVFSWSIVVTRNGTWIGTVSVASAIGSVRGLSGQATQQFQSFSWVPTTIATPLGNEILQSPVPRDGSLSTDGTVWTQASDGRAWYVTGAFTEVPGSIVQAIAAPSGQSFELDTDVSDLYGAMTFAVTLSTTTTDATSYYVAKLDETPTARLYLRADGALVQDTNDLGAIVLATGVVPSFSGMTSVVFAQTSKLTSAFMTTWSLSSGLPQTLIFATNGTVVGVYQGTGVWGNSIRGVMGTDGSRIAGFTWAPNLGPTPLGSGQRTWDDVSGGGTRTWDDVARSTTVVNNPVVARVVQKSPTNDTWLMDSLPVFVDPIVWEFSNDGGQSWHDGGSVRNNPQGAVLFETDGEVNNKLVYRVTSYAPDTWLSNLVIRPWYVGFMRDMPPRAASPHGPNLHPVEAYMPVEQDPHFMLWRLPIPREWWYAFRSLLPDTTPDVSTVPIPTERVLL